MQRSPLQRSSSRKRLIAGILAIFTISSVHADERSEGAAGLTAANATFQQALEPFLNRYCVSCHGGDEPEGAIAFDRLAALTDVQTHFELWEKSARLIRDRQMPPAEETQPEVEESLAAQAAIDVWLSQFDCSSELHPGRVTIRRLNRVEYNNTIRDLTGLDLQPANQFPSDDVGYGFDNIGDVLSIPPVLMEKYLAAADSVAEQLLADKKTRERFFIHRGTTDAEKVDAARRNVAEFATRAFRRPISPDEEERLFAVMKFAWDHDAAEDEIFRAAITAVLTSPDFLFRIEHD
ncbi:MAG: DUF1587 domain-containing protein, partial [Planctomycetaceae bacterium]|nr:DUF1587 domain-containing protein [Planctomycetaceae bacterium]